MERQLDGLSWELGHEDVHTAIEAGLGELGRKIHAGRSRNDRSRQRFASTSSDACAEAIEAIERFALTVLTAPTTSRRRRCRPTRASSAPSP